MRTLYNTLMSDVRYTEGIKSCINCGTCTAICPAAEVYKYEPRSIANLVQTRDETIIEDLLKSDTIWYCGECMSCKTRCPRNNAPGLIIQALRTLSIEKGYFIHSEKGRQQLALKRMIGDSILETGYCVHFDNTPHDMFPESGPIWQWVQNNRQSILEKIGQNLYKNGDGPNRKISKGNLEELRKIFEVTGGIDWFKKIEEQSTKKANDMVMNRGNQSDIDSQYFKDIYTHNDQEKHNR